MTIPAPFQNFMVPGFGKCGSTTLCTLLAAHPDVFIPEIKETNFLLLDDYASRMEEYASHYANVSHEKAIGEGTTMYSDFNNEKKARAAILALYPDIKFIFIARNPFDRIISSYQEFHHSGPNFALNAPFGLRNAINELPALIEDSRYMARVSNYLQYVERNRILVVFFEDMIKDHRSVLKQCYQFLEVAPDFADTLPTEHKNRSDTKLYDSRLLRYLRTSPSVGFKIARISIPRQDQLFSLVGLRRRFSKKTPWEQELKNEVREALREDAMDFLRFAGKPDNFWQGFD